MAVTYTWTFPSLTVARSLGGMTDVVTGVHWTVTASDGTNSATAFGDASIPLDEEGFVPFASLTSDDVKSWLANDLGADWVDSIEGSLANNINPPIVTMPPPWAS
jgi:hypothetical protein